MQLKSLLVLTASVLSVSAAPELAHRHAHKCHGDMEYDPFMKLCKCDKGEVYDADINRCRIKEVEKVKINKRCGPDEKLFCVRKEGDYVPYDRKSLYCLDTKHSKFICAKANRVTEVFKHEITKDYEIAQINVHERNHLDKERRECYTPRYYNYVTKTCECPRNKIWDGHSCHFPILPKPVCPHGKKAYCARDEKLVVEFSKKERLCQDDGKSYVFCCGSKHDHHDHDRYDHYDHDYHRGHHDKKERHHDFESDFYGEIKTAEPRTDLQGCQALEHAELVF